MNHSVGKNLKCDFVQMPIFQLRRLRLKGPMECQSLGPTSEILFPTGPSLWPSLSLLHFSKSISSKGNIAHDFRIPGMDSPQVHSSQFCPPGAETQQNHLLRQSSTQQGGTELALGALRGVRRASLTVLGQARRPSSALRNKDMHSSAGGAGIKQLLFQFASTCTSPETNVTEETDRVPDGV